MRPIPVRPDPGQESVWDYPRPPRLEPVPERLTVVLGGRTIAATTAGFRVLELLFNKGNRIGNQFRAHLDLFQRIQFRKF